MEWLATIWANVGPYGPWAVCATLVTVWIKEKNALRKAAFSARTENYKLDISARTELQSHYEGELVRMAARITELEAHVTQLMGQLAQIRGSSLQIIPPDPPRDTPEDMREKLRQIP